MSMGSRLRALADWHEQEGTQLPPHEIRALAAAADAEDEERAALQERVDFLLREVRQQTQRYADARAALRELRLDVARLWTRLNAWIPAGAKEDLEELLGLPLPDPVHTSIAERPEGGWQLIRDREFEVAYDVWLARQTPVEESAGQQETTAGERTQ